MEAHRAIQAKARSGFVHFIRRIRPPGMRCQIRKMRSGNSLSCTIVMLQAETFFNRIIASIYVESATGEKPVSILIKAGWHSDRIDLQTIELQTLERAADCEVRPRGNAKPNSTLRWPRSSFSLFNAQ
jgi:hypothetical protein